MPLLYIASFLAALLLSFIITRYVRNVATARGLVVPPDSDRHVHDAPLPRLGGVAIFLSCTIVCALAVAASYLFDFSLGFPRRVIGYIGVAGTLVFLLGLYDDLRSARPWLKLAVQSLAATWLYFEGFRVLHFPIFGVQESVWISLPLTILWMLLITNAFNLIDGLDGLASGSALFSTLTVFMIALVSNNHLVATLTVVLAGATLGFLRYNFNPATIFLGDCGSLFIGFMLGALALAGSYKTPTVVAVAIPVVSLGLPILETAISVVRRFLSGQPIFSGDREHIHHKLLEKGFTQRQAVIILYGVSALCGLLSLLLLAPGSTAIGIVLFVLGVGVWLAVQHLGYHEFVELKRVAHRTVEQKRVIANNLAIRRATTQFAKTDSLERLCEELESGFKKNDFDGFQIRLATPHGLPSAADTSCFEKVGGELHYTWRKRPGEAEPVEPAWNMKLDLVTVDQGQVGSFTLFRCYSDKPLLVDINLLISGFNTSLAEAAGRALDLARLKAKEQSLKANAAPNISKVVADFSANTAE